MPNGELTSVIFQTAPMMIGTHLVMINLSPSLDGMTAKLRRKRVPSVTWLTCHGDEKQEAPSPGISPWEDAAETYAAMRPAFLRTVFTSLLEFERKNGHLRTVFIVLSEPASPLEAVLSADLPIDLNLLFFRYLGLYPTVVRLFADPGSEPESRAHLGGLFSSLSRYYFADRAKGPDWFTGNTFDVAAYRPGEGRMHLTWFIERLLALHKKESLKLSTRKPMQAVGIMVMEEAMKRERAFRRLDWFGLGHYPYVPRLWSDGMKTLLRFLDLRAFEEDEEDPWKKYTSRKREPSWDSQGFFEEAGIPLDRESAPDPAGDADAYRLSAGDADGRLLTGAWLTRAGKFDDAIAMLGDIDAEELLAPVLHSKWLGLSLAGGGRHEDASSHLEKAMAGFVRLAEGPETLKGPVLQEAAHLALLRGDLDSAERHAVEALKHDPLLPGALRTHVLALCHKGSFEEAVTSLRRLTGFAGRPDPELARFLLDTLPQASKTENAILLEERSIALLMSGDEKNLGEAEKVARRAWKMAPESGDALLCLVTALANAGKKEDVEKLVQEAREKGILLDRSDPRRPQEGGRLLKFMKKKTPFWKRWNK